MWHRRNRFHIECQASPFCTSRPSRAGPHTGTRRNTMPCPSEWERSEPNPSRRSSWLRHTFHGRPRQPCFSHLRWQILQGIGGSRNSSCSRTSSTLRRKQGSGPSARGCRFLEFNFHCDGVLPRVSGLPFVALDLFLLLHAGDEAPSCTSTSNGALVCDLQQIPLLDRKLRWLFAHLLHALRHSIMAFRLLSGTRLRYHHVRW